MKVTTQAELDAALAADTEDIIIDSPRGVCLEISNGGKIHRVELVGSSTATLWESSTATLWGSSTATLWESSTATLRESSTAVASKYSVIHLHSARANVTGGILVDLTKLDRTDWEDWADYHGVEVIDGEAILFKAVDNDLKSGRGFKYPIGKKVVDKEWKPGDFCGNGLHFCPTPSQAQVYFESATRFLKVAVKLDDISIIDGNGGSTPKAKAKGCRVLAEVDIHGNEIPVKA